MLVPSPDTSLSRPSLASLSDPHNPPAETFRLVDMVDTAHPPGRSPTQGHLLSQGGDPGSRSPGVLPTLLGGHPDRPLGNGDYPSQIHLYCIELIGPPPFLGVQNTPTSLEGLQVLSNEVGDLLRKGAEVLTPRPVEELVLQHLFPGTQEGRRPQTHLELEVLQLECLQDFIQDGDSALHHSHHVPTPVVGQHGPEGRVLPCTSGTHTPPVPQILLAGH